MNTSKKVLDIVMGPHKLLEHLQAMRKYLLLGQGDFIGLLMENLKYALLEKRMVHMRKFANCFEISIKLTGQNLTVQRKIYTVTSCHQFWMQLYVPLTRNMMIQKF